MKKTTKRKCFDNTEKQAKNSKASKLVLGSFLALFKRDFLKIGNYIWKKKKGLVFEKLSFKEPNPSILCILNYITKKNSWIFKAG